MSTRSIGHGSTLIVDSTRGDRVLGLDVWYPTDATTGDFASYELLPGIALPSTKALNAAQPTSQRLPLIIWSHGRTGLRQNYSQLCEALAENGYIVAVPDHPGDTLTDWLTGKNVDDQTNEIQRLGDISFTIDQLIEAGDATLIPDFAIDTDRIYVAGHSYGGLTAIISSTGMHGVQPDRRVRAIAGAQAYTRTLPDDLIRRINVDANTVVAIGGTAGVQGFASGAPGTSTFSMPYGLALDSTGANLFVADSANHAIRRIALSTSVIANNLTSTVAGLGSAGSADAGAQSQFLSPRGVALDASGALLVADSNNTVRKIAFSSSTTKETSPPRRNTAEIIRVSAKAQA